MSLEHRKQPEQPEPMYAHGPPPFEDDDVPVAQVSYNDIMMKFEVQEYFARKMRGLLCGTKRVLIIDNSSSMNQGLSDSPL